MLSRNSNATLLAASLVLSLIIIAHQNLAVYNLQALGIKATADYNNISFSIANFGFVPYGKTLISRLMIAPNQTECEPIVSEQDQYDGSFMLIKRGDCQFVTKALNAQKLGAHMAIIMDDGKHSDEGNVIMADNGYGYKVKIPSIFIKENDGKKLYELLQQNKLNQQKIILKVNFENKKSQKIDVIFWLQSHNRHVYRLAEDFKQYYKNIKDHINFKVVYSNIKCQACPKNDCEYNNKYCAQNFNHNLEQDSGKNILKQQIREEVILQLYPNQWWSFMKEFGQHCATISQFQVCAAAQMKKLGIDSKQIEDKVAASYLKQDNEYLKRSSNALQNSGINRFPSVTLNNNTVKGSLYAEFIFDDICNTLITPPEACQKYLIQEQRITKYTNAWSTILLVVIIGLLIFSAIFVAYRRHMKRKISGEMQSRVDDMVSKYIEFYSERNGKK